MFLYQKYRDDFRQNLRLALPIMTGQLGQVTVNLVDNLMVGRLGAEALAAVSVGNAIFVVFVVVGMGISFALPPLVSKADGADQHRKISQYFKHSLIVNLCYAILSLFIISAGISLLGSIGQDPDVVTLAVPYLKITAWSTIPLMIFQTLRSYSDGMSNTLLPMYAIIAGNIANIVLNYGLIFGHMGLPAMGVSGAALASMIARILMIVILLWLIYQYRHLWLHIASADFSRYKSALFRNILSLGIPTSLQGFFEVTAFSAAALIMGMVGKNEQAAHQISINLASITFLLCTGIAMAATIRVGNQLGRNDYRKLKDAGYSALIQVVMIMSVTALIFLATRHILPTLYINDPQVIGLAAALLIMAAIFQVPDGVQVTALGVLRGLQDVKIPTIITFFSYWIVGIPVSYLAAFYFNLRHIGVWLGLILGLSLSALLLTIRIRLQTKRLLHSA